ncbi:MAG TPA: hypothetical protein VEW07_03825, partial [Solirubrobacterales bacterium]|nr:hypothetical protein [Solirubrobacterales bacterium]
MFKTKTRLSAVLSLALGALAIGAGAAQAELSLDPSAVVAKSASTQAGAHADFHTSFEISRD